MSRRRSVALGLAGAVAALAGGASGTIKAVARADRRRHFKGDAEPSRAVDANLLEPPGTRHHSIETDDGATLHLIELGDPSSRPLVLLHGLTLASRLWHHQLQDLSSRFWVIAPDWRGHGRSSVGHDGIGLERMAADLGVVLDRLDIHDAVVVGHSMGGMILMRFCRDFPGVVRARIGRLVFLSTAATEVTARFASVGSRLFRVIARRKPEWIEGMPIAVHGDLGYVMNRFGFGSRPSAVWVEQARDIRDEMSPVNAGKSLVSLLDHDERETLPTIATPTLVMVGTHDRLTPERQARQIADLVPGAEIVIFEGGGHMLMLERRERFAQILGTFAGAHERPTSPS